MSRDGLSTYGVASEAGGDHVRPPWPDGVVYHGSRLLLVVALALTITALFPPMGGSTLGRFEEGMVLSAPVIAQVPFTIPKSTAELQRERADAAAGVPPTFNYRPEAGDTMAVRLGRLFAGLDSVASGVDSLASGGDSVASGGGSEVVRAQLLEASIVVSPGQALLLMDEATRRLLNTSSVAGVRRYAQMGVVDATESSELTLDRVLVQDPGANSRRAEARENILIGGDLPARIVRDLPTTSPELGELLRLIIISHTVYSLEFDAEVTAADREQVRQAVPESAGNVVQQEAIVRANEPITEADLERLNAYEAELRRLQLLEEPGLQFGLALGAFLLNLSLVAVFGALIYFLRPGIYASLRWLLLQAALVVIYFIVARVIASNGLAPEGLPIAFVVLAMAILWDSRVALVMGLVLAGLTVAQPAFADTDVLFPVMIGGAAAAMSVRVVRRRAQTWVFVAIITGAYAVTLLALSLLGERSAADFAISMAWAGSNAALSAIIAMGFVPVFEWFTGITTDQTLLEWADPNAPLLRRLSLEAPGTYAHTINVANLAELAANAVGAHGLLCRVGLYYHDVGKVLKPHYFVENQVEGRNPHDKLKPDTSAAILIEHVVEGLQLGKEAGLPEVIQRFISEHHGTQLIAFFYSRAQEQLGEDNVDEAAYRYPGPKPRSQETAIAMMADSIESATRVLQEPTPERVRDLVEGIIESKQQDGQLDQAPLTMHEITVLKDTFVKVLSGIYHHRVDYPTTKHLTDAPDDASEEESGSGAESGSEAGQIPTRDDLSGDPGGSDEGGAEGVSEQMELGDVRQS